MAGPDTALLLIDLQRNILLGKGGPEAQAALEQTVERIAGLLDRARRRGFPVLHVQHDGELGHRLERGTPGWEIRPRWPRAAPSPWCTSAAATRSSRPG
jgi:nicotinamidase-related amidase